MKIAIFFTLFLALQASGHCQTNLILKQTIDSLYDIDQSVQWELKRLIENNAGKDSIRIQDSIKKETYKRHIPILKNIYQENGYPANELVGSETSSHFFVLIQHADNDLEFQSSMLPVLRDLSTKGKISKKDYAYLYDRVQRNSGGKQRYGTQLSFDNRGNLFDADDNIIYPKDLENPEKVDKRRKKMGLEPIVEYYENVLKALGRPRRGKPHVASR
ncbi:MAG: hypothetical protein QM786_05940 [Breznakibacter sp.]